MAEWRSEQSKQFWADVGERLKLTRHLLGITEQEVADALLITLRTYRKWERGDRHQQNHEGVFNFAGRYGISYPWLFGSDAPGAEPPRFRLRLVS